VLAHKTLWIALYSQSIMQAAFWEPGGWIEALSPGEHALATPGRTPIDLDAWGKFGLFSTVRWSRISHATPKF
jgi:hypothetical protein